MQDLKVFGEAVERYIRPRMHPIAIKLLKRESDIPGSAQRPNKDLGHRVALCQGFAFARRNGMTLAMLKEDMYCPIGIMVLGLTEPHPFWLEGNTNLERYAQTSRAAARIAQETPRFKVGEYVGAVISPLPDTDFDVDVVLTYCNAAQAMRFIQSAKYAEGRSLETLLLSSAACAVSTVHATQTDECQLVMPCLGDRRYGLTADDELAFATPASRLKEIATGIESSHNAGATLPIRATLSWEAPLVGAYLELAKLIGVIKD